MSAWAIRRGCMWWSGTGWQESPEGRRVFRSWESACLVAGEVAEAGEDDWPMVRAVRVVA